MRIRVTRAVLYYLLILFEYVNKFIVIFIHIENPHGHVISISKMISIWLTVNHTISHINLLRGHTMTTYQCSFLCHKFFLLFSLATTQNCLVDSWCWLGWVKTESGETNSTISWDSRPCICGECGCFHICIHQSSAESPRLPGNFEWLLKGSERATI